jgi:Protein of unknown function (DUF1501)
MLTFLGSPGQDRGKVSRRDVLRVGALALGGLTLPEVLRQRATAAPQAGRGKSVIMIWLRGGPSHIDSYDMKPAAPAEVRSEFRPIATNVPGIQICEHMPRQARIMHRLAILRGIRSNDLSDHTPHYILTGFPDRGKRPPLGSIVSYLRPQPEGLPPYVSLMYKAPGLYGIEGPHYTGPANRPFVPRGAGLSNLSLSREVSLDRLGERRQLLRHFDTVNRAIDQHETFTGMDAFQRQALEMITSPRARDAFDLGKESADTYARYGKFCQNFLMARRLVETGVSVVTLKVGDWDTHEKNFRDMREQLPQRDQGFHALVTEQLADRAASLGAIESRAVPSAA